MGNDVVLAGPGGDTIVGGLGADTITLVTHDPAKSDTVIIKVGDSTARSGVSEANLDHVSGFANGIDHVIISGYASSTVQNVTTFTDSSARTSEGFQAAYVYAYGDGTAAYPTHMLTEYLAVHEAYAGGAATYLFTADHTAVAFNGSITFVANDLVGG